MTLPARLGTPSELAITLATFPGRRTDSEGWSSADEVRGRLVLLGFDCTTQQVAAYLARMARTECPWVERRRDRWSVYWEYRVTRFGHNDIDNRLPGLWWARETRTPGLSVLRARANAS